MIIPLLSQKSLLQTPYYARFFRPPHNKTPSAPGLISGADDYGICSLRIQGKPIRKDPYFLKLLITHLYGVPSEKNAPSPSSMTLVTFQFLTDLVRLNFSPMSS